MPNGCHWWLGSLEPLFEVWLFLRDPWWISQSGNLGGIVFPEFPCWYPEFDAIKRNAICSPYLLFFFDARDPLLSAAFPAHSLFMLIFFSMLQLLVPWTPHICHSTHPCLLLCGSYCWPASVTHLWMRLLSQWYKIHNVICSFPQYFYIRCRACCPDEYIYNLLLLVLHTYMLGRDRIH